MQDVKFNATKAKLISTSHNRLIVVTILFAIGFLLITSTLVRLVAFNQSDEKDKIAVFSEDDIPHRGDIIDRNGELLAVNLATTSIYANPKRIIDPLDASRNLVKVLPDLDYDKLLTDLSSKKSFVWVKRNLTPRELFEVNNLGIPGVYFKRGERRVYPHGNLLAHVLGFVGLDGNGMAGVEKFFDKELLSEEAKNQKIQLSIDVRVQNIVHEELTRAIKDFNAVGAVGVVIDVNTGEIISMVSLPDFDPHNPGKSKQDNLFNRATLGVYEMGSTFKTFTMAMALENKTVKLNDVYDVDKPIKAARFTIHDFHAKGGWLSVPEIFMYSSNIGTAKIAMEMGRKIHKNFVQEFGLTSPLAIEIPEKSKPMYPSDSRWSDISTLTISYGHGIAVTPIHMAQTMSAMVNNGVLHQATLVKHSEEDRPEGKKIISKYTSDEVKKLLRLVVEHGTGRKANVDGYLVGGKTGTANKSQKGGYNRNDRLSSFIGVFPMNEPKFAIVAMVDEPKANANSGGYATGGTVSAPIVGRIISRMGPLFAIKPVDPTDSKVKNQLYLEYKTDHDET